MSPDERAAAVAARVVTDLNAVPTEFKQRVVDTAERLAAQRRTDAE